MTTTTPQPAHRSDADADPFRYGWRLVPRPTPDNPHHVDYLPLT
ncbi:MAG: Uma2 family endonuclease, partial [Roseiflexus sp.]